MYKKMHNKWNNVKRRLDVASNRTYIRSGEIRWVSVGVNIGSEIDGKGVSFTRPCVILHVIGSSLALVAPLTSKNKTNKQFYHKINTKTKNIKQSYICLSQIRVVSQKRVFKRIAKMSDKSFVDCKKMIFSFYTKGEE